MNAIGIISEYNPFHLGHGWMLQQLKARQQPILCLMSGNFVQRGQPALCPKAARAEMALAAGADLVLELPTPWAMAPAETFASGAVQLLARTGVVSHLAFGAECPDTGRLQTLADCLDSAACEEILRRLLPGGAPYAACRQQAVAQLLGPEEASLLERPNNILAIAYLRAARHTHLQPLALPRMGADHDGAPAAGIASASHIRQLLAEGDILQAMGYLPEPSQAILQRELEAGRAPADLSYAQRAILSHLRQMTPQQLQPYDGGSEGLYRRLWDAVQRSTSLEQVLEQAKTKRYPMARLRRMVVSAWLDMDAPEGEIPYLRVLAANAAGRTLLRQMQDAGLPVLTKAADVEALGPAAAELFRREALWTDQYGLCCPTVQPCGTDWRLTPTMQ